MSDALAIETPIQRRAPLLLTWVRDSAPSLREAGLASSSAVLLALAFPNFDLWWLAWIGLAPLLFAVATTSRKRTAFVLGLTWGVIFFYATSWWLTHPMIYHGGVPGWLAYFLFIAPVAVVSVFPAAACAAISQLVSRFGSLALLTAPLVWVAFDWLRDAITGFDWNALGYSQAFHPFLIQSAKWGGAYAVTFLLVLVNAPVTLVLVRWNRRSLVLAVVALVGTVSIVLLSMPSGPEFLDRTASDPSQETLIVGIQPNVPMTEIADAGYRQLLERHIQLSQQALSLERIPQTQHRLLIWPESPMNFSYSRDPQLQSIVGSLARTHRTYVLLNSLEKTADGGSYNSAILVNEQGEKVAQYDKIRLMPFGEYVPLPRWLPGSGSVRSIVGEFTPGSSYTLMPLGALRAGVFICVEAAHPGVAREFTNAGADVLINISNDGYLGPTPVMRQHLANAIFRAVENDRDLIRVTNAGIGAYIHSNGSISETTAGFQEAVRTWTISKGGRSTTFYSRFGDVFAYGCALISLGFISATLMRSQFRER